MNIITSAKYFNNHARYLKNLAKSCKKLCKVHMLSILSILAYFLYLFLEHSLPFLRNLIGQFQCSPQALLAYRPIRLRYCKRIGRYPLVSVDPGSILWRARILESSFFFPFFFFFPLLFFFSLSLSARWFNTYQIPILFLSSFSFFPSLALFFPFFVLL